uniref:glutathione transferase n=1 Tax=Eptatretus burgeri TaxID=7764 RepID=A0A8C4N734_EPTBU
GNYGRNSKYNRNQHVYSTCKNGRDGHKNGQSRNRTVGNGSNIGYFRHETEETEAKAINSGYHNEKLRQGYLDALPGEMKQLAAFLSKGKWFAGDKLTFVDFIMYEYLDQQLMFSPSCLDNVPTLKQYHQHFETLEPMLSFVKSKRGIAGTMAIDLSKFLP